MPHDQALAALAGVLSALRSHQFDVASFCATWRGQAAMLAALPPRYRLALVDLLGRLESGSLFSEESCSFSEEDLHAGQAAWIDKEMQMPGNAATR
jgi:hypothetical protein